MEHLPPEGWGDVAGSSVIGASRDDDSVEFDARRSLIK